MDRLAVLFRLLRSNRAGFLAIEAAMEASGEISRIPVLHSLQARERDLPSRVESILESYGMAVVAYSITTAHSEIVRTETHRLAGHPMRPRIVLVGGGPHAAGDPKACLAMGFDAVCTGEGEEAFLALLAHLYRHSGLASFTSPGFYVSVNGNVRFTGKTKPVSLDHFPPFPFKAGRFGPIEISRGCPFRCKYCQTPVFKGTLMRHRPIEAVLDAVRHMKAKGRTDFRFTTPNGLAYGSSDGRRMDLDRVASLITSIHRELPPNGRIFFGSFPSEVRPEFVTVDAMRLIREHCHNTQIVFGAQSGSRLMLEAMRRAHTPQQVHEACTIVREAGLQPVVDFILGLPRETEDQMWETIGFMEALAREGARIHLHSFMPLPGTPWAGLKPSPIETEIRRRVERLITVGSLFGQWKGQERIALASQTAPHDSFPDNRARRRNQSCIEPQRHGSFRHPSHRKP